MSRLTLDVVADKLLLSGGLDAYELDEFPIPVVRMALGCLDDAAAAELIPELASLFPQHPPIPSHAGDLAPLYATPNFLDYAHPDTLSVDERISAEAACVDTVPLALASPDPTAARHSVRGIDALLGAEGYGPVATLVSLVFRAKPAGDFFGYACWRRSYPSIGCRHGLEVAIVLEYEDRSRVECRYLPPTDEFAVGGPLDRRPLRRCEVVLHMAWERFMWRYRNAWYLRTVLLEVGHAKANFETAAAADGIVLAHLWHGTPALAVEDPFAPSHGPLCGWIVARP